MRKNAPALHTTRPVMPIKMSIIALGVIAVLWVAVGYSIAFAPGSALVGGLQWAGLSGVGVEPEAAYSD